LEAAGAGHVGCLMYTLETLGNLIRDDHEVTALHVAARKGQIAVLIYLIENEIVDHDDVLRAKNGATPAHDAAGTGSIECLRYLFSRTRAGPNDLDNNGATPLHWAAQYGHLNIVQMLVAEAQAPIDVVTKSGITALHLAAAKNHLDVLRWLVGYAFRHHQQPMKLVNAKDKNGSTPLYHSAHNGHLQIVQWLSSKGGGDPTIINSQGLAPLHAATIAGHIQIVQYLFQFGLATAPGGLRTSEGASSLHFAAAENHVEIMQWLLEQIECTGNERDQYLSTPFHDAAENGHIEAIKVLCDHQIDSTLSDSDGNTPQVLAIKNGHSKCAIYLDNYIKNLMKSRVNGSVNATTRVTQSKKIKPGNQMLRSSQSSLQKSLSSFDTEDAYKMANSTGSNNEWKTLHDLMDEAEIKQLTCEHTTTQMNGAEHKRRAFEERLKREQEERRKMFSSEKVTHQEFEASNTSAEEISSQVKLKSASLPKSLATNTRMAENMQRSKDDLDTGSKRGSVWISKLLGKWNTSSNSSSKSWDYSNQRKPRRPNADPYHSIPYPPSPPSVEYLTGKNRVPRPKPGGIISFKEELQQKAPSMWGRDAYDDEDEGSESDNDTKDKKTLQINNKVLKSKKKKREAEKNSSSVTPVRIKQLPGKREIMEISVPKSDVLSNILEKNHQTQIAVNSPQPESPPAVLPVKEEPKVVAPISKVVSARSKAGPSKPMGMTRTDTPIPASFADQLNKALINQEGQKPKALQESYVHDKFQPQPNEISTGVPRILLSRQDTPPRGIMQLQRQLAFDDIDESDDSFTSSSEDEEEDEETESSEEDSNEDPDEMNRPIMARNMGIHGAKIAKEVMLRMKLQRYPSMFRKPIITLNTIVEVRHERAYESSTNKEMAVFVNKYNIKKKVLNEWRRFIQRLKLARKKAELMGLKRRRDLVANAFYLWIQVKNEADVEMEEKILNAQKYSKQRIKKVVFQKWRTITKTGIKRGELEERCLQWLNTQLAEAGKPQITDFFKSLADGVLIITALSNVSGKKAPRFKQNPKIKIHKQDNWKVAYDFMGKLGMNTKDFEPADLADLQEHAIYNMFQSIFKWSQK
jgi:ankyrin repeat protein